MTIDFPAAHINKDLAQVHWKRWNHYEKDVSLRNFQFSHKK